MDLFEDSAPGNAPALSVSELSGAVKRVVEGEFGRVRVRGEVGRVTRAGSGHLYFDLKDDKAVLSAVCWRDAAVRLAHRPQEGIEVIATGRLTTFPGQSRYQLIVESVEPAGLGALMAMLDQRRRQLAAEGLFEPARKRPIPYLPQVIAVVTSPTGAVIRDILHRLRDRFPSRVVIWPVAVQGRDCAPQVAAAISGLNALAPGGAVPRPDLIIVARGGGSVEDLWGFNEEAVVRAVAAGTIPLISAVGHETDTTLIDHAADLRAPTPTAAAEMAVPVLAELAGRLADGHLRLWRSLRGRVDQPRQRLRDLARALGRARSLTDPSRQRLDLTGPRLEPALSRFVRERRREAETLGQPLFARRSFMADRRAGLERAVQHLTRAAGNFGDQHQRALPLVRPAPVQLARTSARRRMAGAAPRLDPAWTRRLTGDARKLSDLGGRLTAARARMNAAARREVVEGRTRLSAAAGRHAAQASRLIAQRRERLNALDRLRQTLGHTQTLQRGFAIVRGPGGGLVTTAAAARSAPRLEIEFHDGRVVVAPASPVDPGATDRGPRMPGNDFGDRPPDTVPATQTGREPSTAAEDDGPDAAASTGLVSGPVAPPKSGNRRKGLVADGAVPTEPSVPSNGGRPRRKPAAESDEGGGADPQGSLF